MTPEPQSVCVSFVSAWLNPRQNISPHVPAGKWGLNRMRSQTGSMMRVHLWNVTLGEMIELNSRGWTCLSPPGLGEVWLYQASQTDHSTSPYGGMSRATVCPSQACWRPAHQSVLFTPHSYWQLRCSPWIPGRCPQSWGSEAYVSFLSRQTMINPLNSPWKPTPGQQICKAESNTGSWAAPWAESLIKMSWSSSLRSMAKRPSILGRTKVLGLANHFR